MEFIPEGYPISFDLGRFCSHLAPCGVRLLAATFFDPAEAGKESSDFPLLDYARGKP